jgi:hypothetical protein
MKLKTRGLTTAEYEHLKTTLEGCYEELEDLMSGNDWYTTELVDRIQTCLEILEGARE